MRGARDSRAPFRVGNPPGLGPSQPGGFHAHSTGTHHQFLDDDVRRQAEAQPDAFGHVFGA